LAYEQALATRPVVFETMEDSTLFQAHNRLLFYTWGARECCLPKGSTRATFKEHYPHLQPGDVLVFEEVLGLQTGEPEDADPTHRHAVRLTQVHLIEDPLGGQFANPPSDDSVSVTEIVWDAAEALPFPLCISAKTTQEDEQEYVEDISIALGNIILADHGLTLPAQPLGTVPQAALFRVPTLVGRDRCEPTPPKPIPPRFRPPLSERPLTHAAPYQSTASAQSAMHWQVADAQPFITLTSGDELTWEPQRDLLNSDRFSREFVVETETDGTAYVRFGDDRYGKRPASGTTFTATYRVGNGVAGNIGAEALVHIVSTDSGIQQVRNPLPARGGIEPESLETVRQNAPYAFRTQERAVTPEDYARVTERHPEVQRAAATFRWTGSWYTVFVTVDRLGGLPVDEAFEQEMRQHLERYRMAGYDLEIDAPRFVSLEIEMAVCVKPDYFRSDVKKALLEVFSDRILPDGRRGVFHPDNFTFGQPVYLSQLYAIAQAVAGVASVEIIKFQRQETPSSEALNKGKLELGRLEIARLDNNPNFPERGVFRLTLEGGK
jgi:uncharacterized phage protein gp47/JayE